MVKVQPIPQKMTNAFQVSILGWNAGWLQLIWLMAHQVLNARYARCSRVCTGSSTRPQIPVESSRFLDNVHKAAHLRICPGKYIIVHCAHAFSVGDQTKQLHIGSGKVHCSSVHDVKEAKMQHMHQTPTDYRRMEPAKPNEWTWAAGQPVKRLAPPIKNPC